MMTLKNLDCLDTRELEVIHDYLNRSKLPTHYIFRKAALATLCITEKYIEDHKDELRRWQLMASILELLYDRS